MCARVGLMWPGREDARSGALVCAARRARGRNADGAWLLATRPGCVCVWNLDLVETLSRYTY
jgi:hypothetical protein